MNTLMVYRIILNFEIWFFAGDVLHGKVFVRLQLSCSSHIEFAFYASNIGRVDLCAHCASPETNKDQELLKKFKVVLPVCGECIKRKKDIPKRNPKKWNIDIHICICKNHSHGQFWDTNPNKIKKN